ncbi:hypothetical protein LZC95_40370 [Pendulispora brunnea]|uniref:YHS domain-containing protein n=1 Tax=Pendulispora brunnea TaxID=2905690 RepID=A0ABZ2K8K0_9BACT
MHAIDKRKLFTRRAAIACGVTAALAIGCKSQHVEEKTALAPEEPIDESFRGCQKSCGSAEAPAGLVLQPDAKLGDSTRCPVSGAAFQITETTLQRSYRGRPVYLCCSGCARYFDAHAEAVALARHL